MAPEHWTRRVAGKLETDGTGTLETEDPGADVGGCGRLIHNHSPEVFFVVQFTEHFLWQRRRCESHMNLSTKQS